MHRSNNNPESSVQEELLKQILAEQQVTNGYLKLIAQPELRLMQMGRDIEARRAKEEDKPHW